MIISKKEQAAIKLASRLANDNKLRELYAAQQGRDLKTLLHKSKSDMSEIPNNHNNNLTIK